MKSENISYLANKQFIQDSIQSFREAIPGLDKKYNDLEKQLQQLWEDLDPDVINLTIENNRCSQCSYKE